MKRNPFDISWRPYRRSHSGGRSDDRRDAGERCRALDARSPDNVAGGAERSGCCGSAGNRVVHAGCARPGLEPTALVAGVSRSTDHRAVE